MARAKTAGPGESLMDGLRNSPETKRLTQEAKHLFSAGSDKLTSRLSDGVTGLAGKLTNIGESGGLGGVGEGAKRLLSGDGPVKSALGAATTSVADKAKGLLGKGGKGGKGGGKPKAMNIEETIDIGVPVSVAYNQWTQFQDFSRFMKGVESVDQTDETETAWRTKVFKSTRTFKAKIQEQVPDRRIAWTSEGSKGTTKGVVTFHPLADDLTRVLVAIEYYPSGVVEKTGNLWRAAGRRTRLDLKNFRRFVMMENEATGSWRGEIRDGKVVSDHDEGESRDDDDAQEYEAESDDMDDETDDDQEEDDEDEDDDEDEADGIQDYEDEADDDQDESDADDDEEGEDEDESPPRRASASKQSGRRSPARKAPARKQPAKKQPARKQTARKQPARKQTARKQTARKQPAKKASARTQPAKKAPARKQPAKKAPARKSTTARTARKQTVRKSSARRRGSR
jgi:uncharacterized membrane protein